ncbi:hypothetical protein ACWD3J_29275 [Streptomyces sp. NPDC002755]|uniref:hypothetical protein n=1 Tax=Streptomyces sp. NPDC002884 TaxID=3154544 RepID=UPI0033305C70
MRRTLSPRGRRLRRGRRPRSPLARVGRHRHSLFSEDGRRRLLWFNFKVPVRALTAEQKGRIITRTTDLYATVTGYVAMKTLSPGTAGPGDAAL